MPNLIIGVTSSISNILLLMFIGGCAGSTTCGIRYLEFKFYTNLWQIKLKNYLPKKEFLFKI